MIAFGLPDTQEVWKFLNLNWKVVAIHPVLLIA